MDDWNNLEIFKKWMLIKYIEIKWEWNFMVILIRETMNQSL